MSFTGTYRHTIDSKGRLIVPSQLREEMAGQKVTLTVWTEKSISVWTGEHWDRLEEQLLSTRKGDEHARRLVRAMGAQAGQDEVDKQGRITVPKHLRDFAGIDRDVVIVGALDHAEIWSPERFEAEQRKLGEDGLEALLEGLDI